MRNGRRKMTPKPRTPNVVPDGPEVSPDAATENSRRKKQGGATVDAGGTGIVHVAGGTAPTVTECK